MRRLYTPRMLKRDGIFAYLPFLNPIETGSAAKDYTKSEPFSGLNVRKIRESGTQRFLNGFR